MAFLVVAGAAALKVPVPGGNRAEVVVLLPSFWLDHPNEQGADAFVDMPARPQVVSVADMGPFVERAPISGVEA